MRHFIVVGAGIAGLNAARHLQRAGCSVTVLEAAHAPGGRIRSVPFHGQTIECGAQFVSSRYRYVLPLLQEARLASRLRKTSAVRPSPIRTPMAPSSSRVSFAASPDIGGR